MRQILPVREVLKARNVWADGGCPFCSFHMETVDHLFCSCPIAVQVWHGSNFVNHVNLVLLLNNILCSTCVKDAIHAVAKLWMLWSVRNDVIWKGKVLCVNDVLRQAAWLGDLWLETYSRTNSILETNLNNADFWTPPPFHKVKCNVDAAVFDDGAGFGAVVRDHNGKKLQPTPPPLTIPKHHRLRHYSPSPLLSSTTRAQFTHGLTDAVARLRSASPPSPSTSSPTASSFAAVDQFTGSPAHRRRRLRPPPVSKGMKFVGGETAGVGCMSIICVGGDGILNEVLNGLLCRTDQKEAISIPIGIIPAGTDNSLVWTVLSVRDPISAAIAIVKVTSPDAPFIS
nr:uncharacterized protein LOC109154171 [Ipomoea batatas]